jgi:C4-dicarboxylate-specific signal transduction histidine kinase
MQAARTRNLKRKLQKARQEARHLQHSLIEAQRLATVGHLACRMVHEFNNILQLIMGRSGNALKGKSRKEKDEALRNATECSRRAADIIAGILGYAMGRQMQSQVMPADRLMESAVNLVAWDIERKGNVRLARRYACSAPVRVIPVRLEQVLLNLILNARHAMCGRGTLTAIVEPAETEGYVALRIRDTGGGIPQDVLKKLFKPFFTTRPRNGNGDMAGGTGLGLCVARDLVRQAGGEIRVDSRVGQGATFSVLLPVADSTIEE